MGDLLASAGVLFTIQKKKVTRTNLVIGRNTFSSECISNTLSRTTLFSTPLINSVSVPELVLIIHLARKHSSIKTVMSKVFIGNGFKVSVPTEAGRG